VKLIIAGSRGITDYAFLKHLIVDSGLWKTYKHDLEIVCGMALHWKWKNDPLIGGVDRLGYDFAKKNKLKLHPFKPDWGKHGNSAGHIRNRAMGDFADGLLALWDGESPGTKGMIEYARSKGLLVWAYKCSVISTNEGPIWTWEEI
jgi:hypothetical protein